MISNIKTDEELNAQINENYRHSSNKGNITLNTYKSEQLPILIKSRDNILKNKPNEISKKKNYIYALFILNNSFIEGITLNIDQPNTGETIYNNLYRCIWIYINLC